MSAMSASDPIAPGRVLADLVPGAWVRDALFVTLFTGLLAASAQVAVTLPFTLVPITGQTFAVLLGAAALGAGRATIGTALYVGLGVAGVPWFAVTGGATFGYVIGFVLAAAVVGRLARMGNDRTVPRTFALMVVGNLVIYAAGASVLALVLGVGPVEAVTLGVVPFLLGDLLKIALAIVVLPVTWKLVERQQG